jgi:ATP-dependent Lhr-like helicase
MELGGEVVGGRFFAGICGLQFASPPAVRRLEQGLPSDQVFWLNAVDPASPCGLGIDGFSSPLPRRAPGNHLVFHGPRLVVTSEGSGRRLTVAVGPDHPHLVEYLGFLKVQLGRAERPRSSVVVESVNGEPAATSPYRPALAEVAAVTRSPGGALRLSRRY